MTSDPTACAHEDFRTDCGVHRLSDTDNGPVTGYMLDVRITCTQCGLPFKFVGLPVGLELQGAAMSFDRTEAHLAISPDGSPSISKLKGFRITERSGRG